MLLSNPHRPDPRVYREAKTLDGHGIPVKIIAWDREGRYPKYQKSEHAEIVRVGPRSAYRSMLKTLTRLPVFWLRALVAARRMKFEIVHSHDFDTLPAGILISRLHRKPLLYDAHEIYSSMIEKDAKGFSRITWRLETCLAGRTDGIVTVNESLAEKLAKNTRRKIHIVRNSPDTGILDGVDAGKIRERYGLRGFVISYLGSLEPGRFVEELVSSVNPEGKVELVIGGTGTLSHIAEEASRKNSSVRFLGSIDSDEALRLTFASDLVIAMLDPTNPNYRASTPVKILDAMACGRPFVTSKGIEISALLDPVGCGFSIPYDKAAFLETLTKAMGSPALLSSMGRKGKEHYERVFSWEKSRDELVTAYHELLDGHG